VTQLYGTVLAMEPEACLDVFRPLEEEGVIPADLHFLLERDSYCMTRLHGAAFHGNTRAVEEMLERIRQNLTDPMQKEVADKIIKEIIARDEYGFTTFYVAAACGHEEIFYKMLTFLKQVLPDDMARDDDDENDDENDDFLSRICWQQGVEVRRRWR
jgi:hypothetical protein